jgi:hypothetical protein
VCDQETPKREAKGPSWTISACEWKKILKQNIKMKTYENIILSFILYCYETGCLAIEEAGLHRSLVFENSQQRITGYSNLREERK